MQWSGARATLGILGGRHYFRVKVLQPLPAPAILAGPDTGPVHLARVGLSAPHVPVGQLGEAPGSFGYGGTGFVCAGARPLQLRNGKAAERVRLRSLGCTSRCRKVIARKLGVTPGAFGCGGTGFA